MNEDALNASLRKFLKTVGVTSQREIETSIRAAISAGKLNGKQTLKARMTLTIGEIGLTHMIDGDIELN